MYVHRYSINIYSVCTHTCMYRLPASVMTTLKPAVSHSSGPGSNVLDMVHWNILYKTHHVLGKDRAVE